MCTNMYWKWGGRICGHYLKGRKERNVVLVVSTLFVQSDCHFFSLLIIFLFGYGNFLECKMQNEEAVGAAWKA